MMRCNRRPDLNWRCHLFYLTNAGEREAVFEVSAPDEDFALRVAERLLRNRPQRAHVSVIYAEAVAEVPR